MKVLAIFNTKNANFAPLMISYCHENGIGCVLDKKTETGQLRYLVEGKSWQIKDLKYFINKEYNEFCSYNKQLKKMIGNAKI
jgi:hypothetical protein